ncbi:MAG: efflux RND transporter periplasmic adaptor subunit, partial [Pirellulales bacterium]
HLECPRILVGWRHRPNSSCQLISISAVAHFDRRSAAVQAMEAALDEVVLHQTVATWPPAAGAAAPASKTLAALAQQEAAQWILGVPLTVSELDAAVDPVGHGEARTREEKTAESPRPMGALLVLGETLPTAHDAARILLTAAAAPLAAALETLWRREPGWLAKGWRTVLGNRGEKRRFLVGGGVLLALLSLSAPWPYSLSNDCRLEPVQRRFVASPFEGVLEEACVKPGDVVQEGDLLARLDGREIRWKRAALEADRQQASKKRDAAQAAHNYAEQQIAQLEIARLEVELRLLDHRAAHLEIRSPIAGVIASGDLERAAGAPLQLGQTLFEVAPLDRMLVEIAVPDDDVSHLRAGQSLEVRLDAFPGQIHSTTLVRVHPRAEVRDGVNVFVAEGPVNNTDGQLRPGMKGRARLSLGWRPAGWVLFHKPWEYLTKLLAW